MKIDSRFMAMAIDKALESIKEGGSPFGSVIVRGGEVVSCEHNLVLQTGDVTAHAEVVAIRSACRSRKTWDLSGCTIYSTCEPCPMCFSAIHWARIGTIVYGATVADADAAGFNELKITNAQLKQIGGLDVEICDGVLQEACVELFAKWLSLPGHRAY